MMTLKKQQGLGAIAWLTIIVVVVIFGVCAAKMIPAYTENLTVEAGLRSLTDDIEPVHEMSKGEIRQKLSNFYTINNVRGPATENLEIDRNRDRTLVQVNYEVRESLFANIAVVMTFNNQLDSSKPEECCSGPTPENQ